MNTTAAVRLHLLKKDCCRSNCYQTAAQLLGNIVRVRLMLANGSVNLGDTSMQRQYTFERT